MDVEPNSIQSWIIIGVALALLIYAIAAPIAVLVYVSKNKTLSKILRSVWVVAILILGPIAAGPYLAYFSKDKSHRWLHAVGFVVFIVALIVLMKMIPMPDLGNLPTD